MTAFLERPSSKILPLESGDRLNRYEFERRYVAMPHVKKAELIEGIVYMASPLRLNAPHLKQAYRWGFFRYTIRRLRNVPRVTGVLSVSLELWSTNTLE